MVSVQVLTTHFSFGRLECPFDTAVQLAAYNMQGEWVQKGKGEVAQTVLCRLLLTVLKSLSLLSP